MTVYIFRRLAQAVPTVLAVTVFAFALGSVAPGDAAFTLLRDRLGEPPTTQQVEEFREELGLNDSIPVQYARWLGDAGRGDLGMSLRTRRPVTSELLRALPFTLQLASAAFGLAIGIGIPLGLWVAIKRHRIGDHLSRAAALGLASVPNFWLGYLLIIVFSVHLGVLPSQGVGSPLGYVLPALTLAATGIGIIMRLTRASVIEVLNEEFVVAARTRGIPRSAVLVRHVLRVALNPVVTYAGILVGGMLGGTVIIETVFGIPGMGKLVVDAINQRDLPVVQGFVVYFGVLVIVVNLLVDLLYGVLDPRVRLDVEGGVYGAR